MTFVQPPEGQSPGEQYPRQWQYPQSPPQQGQYPQPQPPQPPQGPLPPGRVVDITMSVVILVLAGVVLIVLVGIALIFGLMSSGSCNVLSSGCSAAAAWPFAVIVPSAIFIATIAVTIARLRRRRSAWWIALLGSVAAVVIWLLCSALVSAANA